MSSPFDASQLADQLKPLTADHNLVVGFSGGLDSTVLLHALVAAKRQGLLDAPVRALHVNHGINPLTDQWQQHCRQFCHLWQVDFQVVDAGFSRNQQVSEEQLRHARYRCFEQSLATRDLLLLAHHAEDQAETLLYRLMRGTGIAGAAAMPENRTLGQANLCRPLLDFTKDQLRAYACMHELAWIEDDSNLNLDYDRNFLRHRIRPLLEQRWPAAVNNLLRFSHICGETRGVLDYFLDQYLSEGGCSSDKLAISVLHPHPQAVQKQLVGRWLERAGLCSLTKAQRQEIWQGVVHAAADAKPCFDWNGRQVRRYQEHLYLVPTLPDYHEQMVLDWQPDQPVSLAGARLESRPSRGSGLRWNSQRPGLTLRFRQGGERCQPAGRTGSRLLKKLLQEYDVPPWWRDRVPLVYQGDQLVAVADLCVCEGFQAREDEEGRVFSWTPEVTLA